VSTGGESFEIIVVIDWTVEKMPTVGEVAGGEITEVLSVIHNRRRKCQFEENSLKRHQ
jgi:hypothetical protein